MELISLLPLLDDFAALQRHHLQLLENGAVLKREEWEERESLFQRLRTHWPQKALEERQPDDNAGNKDLLGGRLAIMIENEHLLYKRLENLRNELQEKLGDIRRGKTAIGGYGSRTGAFPKPRFLSMKS